MIVLGIDYGDARTGLAISDSAEVLASPLAVIHAWNVEKVVQAVMEAIFERQAEMVVIGLPLNMDGSAGERAEKTRTFGEKLATKTELPIYYLDERLSTVSAHNFMNEMDIRGKKRKATIDARAAAIILENFLNKRRNERDS